MKRLLLLAFIVFIGITLISCGKDVTTEPINEQEYPFVDDEGRLNVDVSDYEFD